MRAGAAAEAAAGGRLPAHTPWRQLQPPAAVCPLWPLCMPVSQACQVSGLRCSACRPTVADILQQYVLHYPPSGEVYDPILEEVRCHARLLSLTCVFTLGLCLRLCSVHGKLPARHVLARRLCVQVATGVCTYFDRCLHIRLLYDPEVAQAEQVHSSVLLSPLAGLSRAAGWLHCVCVCVCARAGL